MDKALRAQLAGMAMAARRARNDYDGLYDADIIMCSISDADALLAELEKGEEKEPRCTCDVFDGTCCSVHHPNPPAKGLDLDDPGLRKMMLFMVSQWRQTLALGCAVEDGVFTDNLLSLLRERARR